MKTKLYNILLCVMSLLVFEGCDVHEFPEERHVLIPFLLHLDFNTEMPLHKEVIYTRKVENDQAAVITPHDVRYIVKAYRTDNMRSDSREADTTFVFTKSDLSDLNYTAPLELYEGTYDFRVWCDYVDAGSNADKYYDTRDFSEIILANKNNHVGSNDYRDAFRGYATATVTNPSLYTGSIVNTIDNQATAEMKRPMGKFAFISNDVEDLLVRVAQMLQEKGLLKDTNNKDSFDHLLQSVNWSEYTVVFRYNVFMPCSFNMFTDKPADSWTGMTFTSRMSVVNEKEMLLGYDYIFVNGSETTLSISLEIYNDEGIVISSTNPIDVPIARSKLTVVKGDFFTAKATGGVTINPGYDGPDYNIRIY